MCSCASPAIATGFHYTAEFTVRLKSSPVLSDSLYFSFLSHFTARRSFYGFCQYPPTLECSGARCAHLRRGNRRRHICVRRTIQRSQSRAPHLDCHRPLPSVYRLGTPCSASASSDTGIGVPIL